MPPANRPMTPSEWGLLLVLSVLWGGSFFFVGVALRALPPLTLVVLRVGLAALILGLVLRVRGVPVPRGGRVWLAFLGAAFLNNAVPFCLIAWGQTHIASGLAAILNATTPLFGVLVAHVLTDDERLTGNRLAGVVAGLAGVAVMVGPSVLAGLGGEALAQGAVLLAALSYAFAGIYGRRFKRMGIPPLAAAAGQVTAASVLLLPVALAVDRPWTLPAPPATAVAAVLGLAALSTALAYVIFFRLLASAGATNLMLVTFLIPVSALLLGALVLGEPVVPRQLLGMALIGAGLVAIDGRLLRRRRPAAAE
ncbi:DMT family transporter [Methylobacterium platani]|uniref:ABC transporter permease n=2 Tax=Methylobacterium platani TaxID=427683 RepID=A0A179SLB3_9HYPH|nr:DMT family transporter [Methylobacterium platani]KMO14387.1 ABC transporter permease [Methylobacterium platani JCM 14648]OAS27283.1 ABC transporter permease [Methylobacterium platani]